MTQKGVAIVHSTAYLLFKSLYHMQCTNFDYSEVGFVCIGHYTKHPNSKRRQKKLKNMQSGPVHDCFICIPQGYVWQGSALMVVVHKLSHEKIAGATVAQMMERHADNTNDFVRDTFDRDKSLVAAEDIEFVYLNQIARQQQQRDTTLQRQANDRIQTVAARRRETE